MKLKKFAAVIMSMSLALSMAQTAYALNIEDDWNTATNAAIIEEDIGIDATDNYSYAIEATDAAADIESYGVMPMSSTTKSYSINSWSVAAGRPKESTIKVYMTSGDTFKFNITYTPTTAKVEIGVVQPDKTFMRYTKTDGKLSATLKVTQNGIYYFKVINDSTSTVNFAGTYTYNATNPFEYMFKSPKMATYISSEYGEVRSDGTHYALDITTGVAGGIKNYPVYNTLTGKVIKNGYFTDNVTTCVAITHTNGYTSRFLHMDVSDNGLTLNGNAATGKQIGKVSNKGCSAYHLHLDVNTANTYNGPSLTSSNTVNPKLLFPDVSFT